MSAFALAAKVDRYGLQKLFARKEINRVALRDLSKLVELTSPLEAAIDPDKIKALTKAMEEAGGVAQFCRDNTQFNENTLKHIMYVGRKTMARGKVLQELFEHFGI